MNRARLWHGRLCADDLHLHRCLRYFPGFVQTYCEPSHYVISALNVIWSYGAFRRERQERLMWPAYVAQGRRSILQRLVPLWHMVSWSTFDALYRLVYWTNRFSGRRSESRPYIYVDGFVAVAIGTMVYIFYWEWLVGWLGERRLPCREAL